MEALSTQSKMWSNAGHNNYDFVKVKLVTELIMGKHACFEIKILQNFNFVSCAKFSALKITRFTVLSDIESYIKYIKDLPLTPSVRAIH